MGRGCPQGLVPPLNMATQRFGQARWVYYRVVCKAKKGDSGEMPGKSKRVYFLALFLVGVLLGAQMHCCLDLSSRTMDSHLCPICSTTGTAIATPSVILAMAPAINRLEVAGVKAVFVVVVLRNVAPRAPPAS